MCVCLGTDKPKTSKYDTYEKGSQVEKRGMHFVLQVLVLWKLC